MSRSNLAIVRNPLLALPSAQAVSDLPADSRAALRRVLMDIRADARLRADECWKKHKAPMAAYWKAVSVYAGHAARLTRDQPQPDICPNCDTALPEGCLGLFREDGKICRLNEAVTA